MTNLPKTMAGVQLIGHGGPEKLIWNDAIPLPHPGSGEVLVRVLAAGVNNTDINTRLGWYSEDVTGATAAPIQGEIVAGGWAGMLEFPRIQGADLCGEVVALGENVTTPKVGARVTTMSVQDCAGPETPLAAKTLGSEMDGSFAEYCLLAADQVFNVSASPLSDIEIGAMPCAFGTAWGMLERARVSKGDDVFVTGASGGVGLAAVMLARLLGANIIAQAAPTKAEHVRAAGASQIIGRTQTPAPGSCNVWIDLVGGPTWGQHLKALRPGGRIAVAGAIAGPIIEADLRTIYLADLTIFGCTHQSRDTFQGLVDLINGGHIRPLVSQTYALRDITKAQDDFTTKRYPGKLVLIP